MLLVTNCTQTLRHPSRLISNFITSVLSAVGTSLCATRCYVFLLLRRALHALPPLVPPVRLHPRARRGLRLLQAQFPRQITRRKHPRAAKAVVRQARSASSAAMRPSLSARPIRPSAARAGSGSAGIQHPSVRQCARPLRPPLRHLRGAGDRSPPVLQEPIPTAARAENGRAGIRVRMAYRQHLLPAAATLLLRANHRAVSMVALVSTKIALVSGSIRRVLLCLSRAPPHPARRALSFHRT